MPSQEQMDKYCPDCKAVWLLGGTKAPQGYEVEFCPKHKKEHLMGKESGGFLPPENTRNQ